jgi:signal transduction histidine kinase
MRADQLVQDLSWTLFVLIFVLVAIRAARRPTRAHVDMTLFFGALTAIIGLSVVTAALAPAAPPRWVSILTGAAVMALPYLLLRLVADFSVLPVWLLRATEVGLFLSVVAIGVLPTPLPAAATLVLVAYFVAVVAYESWAFVAAASRSRGVTRRRMQAAAAGSACIGAVLFVAGVGIVKPDWSAITGALSQVLGLASAICYLVGFAPPTWLRRAWQEPELRGFLGRAASLPRLGDTRGVVRELERTAADMLGGAGASLGLWDPQAGVLRFSGPADEDASEVWEIDPHAYPISGRPFLEQRARLVSDVSREDPQRTAVHAAFHTRAALAAPVTAGDKRMGVLVVYAHREPMFANSDLELIQLVADQAAVILESHALIEDATRVRALEETTRLKEDFLSSAAHDLKTPLTGMLSQAQLLLRRAQRDPGGPVDQVGLERLVREGRRLKALVQELLDASWAETTAPPDAIEAVDLAAIARDVCRRRRGCTVDGDASVIGRLDPVRMRQLLERLVENAVKFSPAGGDILVRVWREGDAARVAVIDQGIGIPPQDLPLVFDRFHRGSNVDDRRFAGLGLGLHVSRRIVELHGGRIWAESNPGTGSTFHVELPLGGRLDVIEPRVELAGA